MEQKFNEEIYVEIFILIKRDCKRKYIYYLSKTKTTCICLKLENLQEYYLIEKKIKRKEKRLCNIFLGYSQS